LDDFRSVMIQQGVSLDEIEPLFGMCGGSPGLGLRLRDGIAAAGGIERFDELLSGELLGRPEALIDLVPPVRSDETKRDRVRRLVELVLDGIRGRRPEEPDARERLAKQSLEVADLHRGLDVNLNGELVLERLCAILRG